MQKTIYLNLAQVQVSRHATDTQKSDKANFVVEPEIVHARMTVERVLVIADPEPRTIDTMICTLAKKLVWAKVNMKYKDCRNICSMFSPNTFVSIRTT